MDDDALRAPRYVELESYLNEQSPDDFGRWIDLKIALARGFDEICGDTFCEGDYTNLQPLGIRCSVAVRTGELSRCAAIYKTDDIPVNKSLGTVVAERAFDLLLLVFILGFITLSQLDMIDEVVAKLTGETQSDISEPQSFFMSRKFMLLAFMVIAGSVFLLFRKRLLAVPIVQKALELAKGFWEGIMTVRKIRKPSLFWLYSSGIWLGYLMMMYCCLKGMDATNELGMPSSLVASIPFRQQYIIMR